MQPTTLLSLRQSYLSRRGNYLTALNRALEAMKSVNRAKKIAPDFPDLQLGDGLYNYWRTVISRNVKGLPDFADKRMQGIEQLEYVQDNGIFLGPAATFALTYTWLEEGALKRATQSALRNHRAYPDNVVNNLMAPVPQKHVGIHYGGMVFNFSNSQSKVVADNSVEAFHSKFKSAYAGNDISLYFGVAP